MEAEASFASCSLGSARAGAAGVGADVGASATTNASEFVEVVTAGCRIVTTKGTTN